MPYDPTRSSVYAWHTVDGYPNNPLERAVLHDTNIHYKNRRGYYDTLLLHYPDRVVYKPLYGKRWKKRGGTKKANGKRRKKRGSKKKK